MGHQCFDGIRAERLDGALLECLSQVLAGQFFVRINQERLEFIGRKIHSFAQHVMKNFTGFRGLHDVQDIHDLVFLVWFARQYSVFYERYFFLLFRSKDTFEFTGFYAGKIYGKIFELCALTDHFENISAFFHRDGLCRLLPCLVERNNIFVRCDIDYFESAVNTLKGGRYADINLLICIGDEEGVRAGKYKTRCVDFVAAADVNAGIKVFVVVVSREQAVIIIGVPCIS